MLYLSQFNFNLKYILEIKIGKIDRLSKRLDWKVRVEKDNFFFLIINNLLHRVHRQAVVATFVAMYMKQDTTWRREKRKKEERGRLTKRQVDMKTKETRELNRD